MCRIGVCGRCGESFTSHARRGRMPKWCQSCKAQVAVEQHANRRRLRSSTGYARRCVYCAQEWLARSPKARYCSERCQYLASGGRVILTCERCGCDFECMALQANAGRRFCSKACTLDAKRRDFRPCLECGKPFAPKPKKDPRKGKGLYCSKRCAGAARRAGKRTGRWREAQELRACRAKIKPSQKMYAAVQQAMRRQWASIASLYAALNASRSCLHCGAWLSEKANKETLFCSIRCSAQYEWECSCSHCSTKFVKRGVHGSQRALCSACRLKAKREQHAHKSIASRARKFGVCRARYSRRQLLQRDGWACQLCGVALLRRWTINKHTFVPHPRNATLDHIVPMALGGDDAPWNIQACCFKCNCKKSSTSKGQLRLRL